MQFFASFRLHQCCTEHALTLSGMGQTGHFYPYVFVRSDFVCWYFFKNFQTLLEVKIELNRIILTPCLIKVAPWLLQRWAFFMISDSMPGRVKPWFNILLHKQSLVCATVDSQCLEYLGHITLPKSIIYSLYHYSLHSLNDFGFRNSIVL